MPNLYFITGACGSGKSAIIPYLKKALKNIDIHDFDEKGVPPNPKIKWRLDTTDYWLKIAKKNAKNNKSTIICGLTMPQEVEKSKYSKSAPPIHYCLLDISIYLRRKRLRQRKERIQELEKFTGYVLGLRKWVRKTKFKHKIINTNKMTLEQKADEAIDWIKKNEK